MFLIVSSLYNYFTDIQRGNQQDDLNLVSVGVSEMGMEYLTTIHTDQYRITWIDEDGTVLFDSRADESSMENHSDREEFIEAMNYGMGESTRVSTTLSEETLYSAKKLSDGTVVRVSFTQLTVLSLLYNVLFIIVLIAAISVVFSIFLASKIAKKMTAPINALNLDDPLQNEIYDEITPLLYRIDRQNKKIESQIEALKEHKQEISFITENVEDGIIILDKEGQVLSCNKVAKDLLSCKEDSFYLNFFRDIDYEKLIENALNGERGKVKIVIGNEVFSFSASPSHLYDSGFSVFVFIHNITEEETSLELRRQFSANVSHELKTPLTSIMGASELLASGIVKSDDVSSFAKNIHNEASRLLRLVQDIIKISRLDEQSKFDFEIVDIAFVTDDVLKHLKNKAEAKGINIMLNKVPANITAVPTILYEMIYNLCDNAIDYNKQDGEIVIDISKTGNDVIWKIQDTGMGISKEHLPRIFERFYRVDKSHSKETGGTGLGLSIVKNGANLHKAILDVNSTVEKGTEITLTFSS